MTAPERLAKVAEVLGEHAPHVSVGGGTWFVECLGIDCRFNASGTEGGFDQAETAYRAHVAQALGSLLDEFRAEDEARALREAADAGASSTATDQLWRMWLRDRAALAAVEPDAGAR